jgi:hypothetical protein
MDIKNRILIDMIQKQRKNISQKFKLEFEDIKRIVHNIHCNPFEDQCCIWNGYVTNGQQEKARYVNFYFKHRKIALHRLLYINYVDDIIDKQYLRFTCENKGSCCNINHIEKCNNDTFIQEEKINNTVDIKRANIQVTRLMTQTNNVNIISSDTNKNKELNNTSCTPCITCRKNKFIIILSD